jgi:hypothetical protein
MRAPFLLSNTPTAAQANLEASHPPPLERLPSRIRPPRPPTAPPSNPSPSNPSPRSSSLAARPGRPAASPRPRSRPPRPHAPALAALPSGPELRLRRLRRLGSAALGHAGPRRPGPGLRPALDVRVTVAAVVPLLPPGHRPHAPARPRGPPRRGPPPVRLAPPRRAPRLGGCRPWRRVRPGARVPHAGAARADALRLAVLVCGWIGGGGGGGGGAERPASGTRELALSCRGRPSQRRPPRPVTAWHGRPGPALAARGRIRARAGGSGVRSHACDLSLSLSLSVCLSLSL